MKYPLSLPVLMGTLFLFFGGSCTNAPESTTNTTATHAPDEHNSQSSLDWQGRYRGILPCADCEGIEIVITLNENNSFNMYRKYLGKEDAATNVSGIFSWAADGNKIILDKANGNQLFLVGENQLFWLDNEGNRITGDLAMNYRLEKQADSSIY